MSVIEKLSALEVLDSRGRPTVQVSCRLTTGASASASIPSGASRGRAEVLEVRDGDASRYAGLGCRKAVAHVNNELCSRLTGTDLDQRTLDNAMVTLDGTPNKSRLGANALLGVSIAFARASAVEARVPLYQYFANMARHRPRTLPRPMINLFSGGAHAGGQMAIQDVLIVPWSAAHMSEALEDMFAVYRAAAQIGLDKYRARPLTADEGGLAPPFPGSVAAIQDAVEAVVNAGLAPGETACLAVDVASSQFAVGDRYELDDQSISAQHMIRTLRLWCEKYPIVAVEDGLAEDDWAHWPLLSAELASHAWLIGDDLLCTNPDRIRRAIRAQAANALLLKVNQVGTLSEALQSNDLARSAGWRVVVSARSGETEDNWLADLAVGWGADCIKVGSIMQSERLAKYNRLLTIEAEERWPLAAWMP